MKKIKPIHQLGLILLITLLSINLIFSQTLIDTEKLSMKYYDKGYGLSDCTIRATVPMYNIDYEAAADKLNSNGKIDGQGMALQSFIDVLVADNMFEGMTDRLSGNMTAKKLIKHNSLSKSQNYLMYVEYYEDFVKIGHIYFMTYKESQWYLYGNRGDKNKKIYYIVGVKKD